VQHNNIQNSNKKNNTNNFGNNYANHSSKNDDNTFSQLKELQTLYKKESALKELFYKKKLDVLNVLNKIYSKNFDQEMKKCVLYEDKAFLGNLNNYVQKF
jgi:hypothetical protein